MASLHRESFHAPPICILRQYSKSVIRYGLAVLIGQAGYFRQGCIHGICPSCCKMLPVGDRRKLRGLEVYLDSHRPC